MATRLIKLDSLRADLEAQKEGQWQPAKWPGVRFMVRSINYEPYTNERDRERERLAAQYIGGGNIPNSVWNQLIGRLLAEHILLGWEGISPAYDPHVAHDVLTAADGGALRDAVIKTASRVGVRELEFVTELEKKLRRCLRYQLTRKGTDEYLQELARAEPDVVATIGEREAPPQPAPDYAQRYLNAFNALIYDRPYATVFRVLGSPHGMPVITSEIHDMPITLATLEGYAERHGIVGADRARFVRLLTALDKEYRAVLAEQRGMIQQAEEENDYGDGS